MTRTDIAGLQQDLRQHRYRVADVVAQQLERIQAQQHALSAYIDWDPEAALEIARSQDAVLSADPQALPPLFGVTFSVKDTIDVAGMRTTASSRSRLNSPVASRDALVVERLRQAGAICLGKANCHEFAFGGPSFDLPVPPALNPWKSGYFPGGSSSGSGTTVAAGLCHASVGTDTAGSIRSPSTHCGLVGLKPSYGQLPLDGVHPLSLSLDHVGPLARTVADCGLLYDIMAGRQPSDAGAAATPGRPLRLGIPTPDWGLEAELQPEAARLFTQTLARCRDAGIDLVPVELPELDAMHVACGLIMMAEVAYVFGPSVREHFDQFGRVFRGRVLVGERIPASAYLQALQDKLRLQRQMAHALATVDALVLPGATAVAGPLDEVDVFYFLATINLNAIANLTGQPALAMPTGMAASGVPFGIQLLGRHHHEHDLLRVAARLEPVIGFDIECDADPAHSLP